MMERMRRKQKDPSSESFTLNDVEEYLENRRTRIREKK